MFFFFVGGIQPKRRVLDPAPRVCPRCGLPEARLTRLDPYLSLFFIPLFPVGRGETQLACGRCGYEGPPGEGAMEPRGPAPEREEAPPRHCPGCGAAVQPGHRWCPYCGQRL